MYTHTCTDTYINTCLPALHTDTHMHRHKHTSACTTHTQAQTYTNTHVHALHRHTQTHTWTDINTHLHALHTHTQAHTHTAAAAVVFSLPLQSSHLLNFDLKLRERGSEERRRARERCYVNSI